jgi:hypothetical protein
MWHDARYMNPCGVEMDERVVTSDGKASLSIVTARREDGTAFLHAHQQWFSGQTGLGDPGHYAENSLQATRSLARRLQGFKSLGHTRRFLAAYGPIASHFRPRRHRLSAPEHHQKMAQ